MVNNDNNNNNNNYDNKYLLINYQIVTKVFLTCSIFNAWIAAFPESNVNGRAAQKRFHVQTPPANQGSHPNSLWCLILQE